MVIINKIKNENQTAKSNNFPLLATSFHLLIILLATIGDTVILTGRITFFLLKKAILVIRHSLHLFVLLLISSVGFWLRQTAWLQKKSVISLPQFRTVWQAGGSFWSRTYLWFKQHLNYGRRFFTKSVSGLTKIAVTLKLPIQKHLTLLPRLPAFPRLRRPHPLFTGAVLGSLFTFLFVFIPFNVYTYLTLLPNPRLLSQRVIPVTTQIFDRNGNLLYEIYNDEDRKPVPLQDIPEIVKQATIAIEDKSFYSHPGFSITSIARAAKETFVNHHTQGGSTITQQLIKNALLTPEVSLRRKIREIILAFWAERLYTKNQILEMYLNQVPYGGTAWGIEAAAQMYFGKSVENLSLAEAAYLAGLPAAPTLYSPYGTRPDLAKVRQSDVLRRMVEEEFISEEESQKALTQPIVLKPHLTNIKAPHFVMYVRQLLSQKFGARAVDQGGLRITTTLDLPLQEQVEQIVHKNIAELASLKVGNGAALVVNPKNGDILTMVGSYDYFDTTHDGNVNVVLSERQPGSSIKVVTYAAALTQGFTASSVIEDSPVVFTAAGQTSYAPVNYDGRFHGLVTLRAALANSYNVPAVKVLNRIGLQSMLDMGKKMGVTTWTDETRFGLSLTLGGGEVTLLDLSTVYATLANNGVKILPDPILKVTDYTGKIYYEKGQPTGEAVLNPGVAFILSDILSDNQTRSSAFGQQSALSIPGKTVAVKTGTTNDKRDNWTIGYTPNLVVGVWVGNNDNSPMHQYLTSGITGAAPIWNKIMTDMLKNSPNPTFIPPPQIVTKTCGGRTEYYLSGTEPKSGCNPLPSPLNPAKRT